MRNRHRGLWLLATILLVSLVATLVLAIAGGARLPRAFLDPESRRAALLGLAALVLGFALLALTQQRRLATLEDEARRRELREAILRARLEELGALFDASHELAGPHGNGALEVAAERLRLTLEADACVIYVEEAPAGPLSPRAVSGEEHARCSEQPVHSGEGVAGLVHGSGRGMLVDVGPLLGRMAVEMNLERAPGTAMCVPVRAGGNGIGVISVIRFDPANPFRAEHARLLESFAASLGRAIDEPPGTRAA